VVTSRKAQKKRQKAIRKQLRRRNTDHCTAMKDMKTQNVPLSKGRQGRQSKQASSVEQAEKGARVWLQFVVSQCRGRFCIDRDNNKNA
jgi:hypothetical protein